MYRTDKQFMTNPATAASRIYIGGLAKTIVASDLEEKFNTHGKILGLVLQQGFAFIQFESAFQAQAAIENESNTVMHGRKITVKQALDKSQKGGNQNRRGPPQQQQQLNFQPPPQQQQSPQKPQPPQGFQKLQEESLQATPNAQELDKEKQERQSPKVQQSGPNNPLGTNSQQGPKNQPPPTNIPPLMQQTIDIRSKHQQSGPPKSQHLGPGVPPNFPSKTGPPLAEDLSSPNDGPPEKRPRKRLRSRERFPRNDRFRDDNYYGGRDDYPPQGGGYGLPPTAPPIIEAPPQPDRNDCEIIVVSKPLTKYAEYIEQRLKSLGLIVDLLFPNEDVPIGRVLANISSRGCLYAILIMPQNEEHRSLTLNILHGLAQEHRNMPLEDALVLITRNFDAYMRGDKTVTETLGPGGVSSVSDRHPTSMQLLLNLLAENRQITSGQYEKLLKYLQERREVQGQHETAEGINQDSQESNTKQAELQSRIMNILNKAAVENPPPPPPPENSQSTDAPPLLKDPSVQKALDSLLGGEMFKNMSGTI